MTDLRPDRAHAVRRRIIIILAITAVVEIGLIVMVRLGPALGHLMQPVYVVVAAIGAFSVWHALRRHPGADRRHGDRRQGAGPMSS